MAVKPNVLLEAEVIRRFVIKSKRARYLSFVMKPQTRPKLIHELHHLNFLNYELFDKITGGVDAFIRQRLRALPNLSTCYVISESSAMDGQILPVDEALAKAIGADMGTLLVFGNADIVYAEAEGMNHRWISRFPSPHSLSCTE